MWHLVTVNDRCNHIGSYDEPEKAINAFWDHKKKFSSSLVFLRDGRNGKRYSHAEIEKMNPKDFYTVKI